MALFGQADEYGALKTEDLLPALHTLEGQSLNRGGRGLDAFGVGTCKAGCGLRWWAREVDRYPLPPQACRPQRANGRHFRGVFFPLPPALMICGGGAPHWSGLWHWASWGLTPPCHVLPRQGAGASQGLSQVDPWTVSPSLP